MSVCRMVNFCRLNHWVEYSYRYCSQCASVRCPAAAETGGQSHDGCCSCQTRTGSVSALVFASHLTRCTRWGLQISHHCSQWPDPHRHMAPGTWNRGIHSAHLSCLYIRWVSHHLASGHKMPCISYGSFKMIKAIRVWHPIFRHQNNNFLQWDSCINCSYLNWLSWAHFTNVSKLS